MNNIKLIAAVTAVAVSANVRSKLNKKPAPSQTIPALINLGRTLLGVAEDLNQSNADLLKQNDFLLAQNRYFASMIDEHDVPITEFDRIALSDPLIVKNEK